MNPSPGGVYFDFEGQNYFLPSTTQGDKKEFHGCCNARVIEIAKETAKYQSEEEGYQTVEDARAKCNAGYYWWDEPGGYAIRSTKEAYTLLVWIALKRKYPKTVKNPKEFSIDIVRRMADVEWGVWIRKLYNEANPTPPPPTGDTNGENSTLDSDKNTDSAPEKSVSLLTPTS